MFTNPEFLWALGSSSAVGIFTAVWITWRMRGALDEFQIPAKIASFWIAVIQLCALFFPVFSALAAEQLNNFGNRPAPASIVVSAACFGALLSVLLSAIVVGTSGSSSNVGTLSARDYSELKQLLLRMREFRAHEIVRSSELAAKADQN